MRKFLLFGVLPILCSAASPAFASQPFAAAAHLQILPKTRINIAPGTWSGPTRFSTNGVVINHNIHVCVKEPAQFLRQQLGAKSYQRYAPVNCSVTVQKNTRHDMIAQSICVPPSMVGKALSYYQEHGKIKGFPIYRETKYLADYRHGILRYEQVILLGRLVKHHDAISKKTVTSVLHYSGDYCHANIPVPTNSELKKEGKTVPTNKNLEKQLTRQLGKNPFKKPDTNKSTTPP